MTRTLKIFSVALLTIVGLLGTSVPSKAQDRDDDRHERCERRIHQAEEKLQSAIQRHGEDSRQAHKRHEQLEEVRRECGDRRDMEHHDMDHHDDQPHQ